MKFQSKIIFQHACKFCPSVINLKEVIKDVKKKAEAGEDEPMTVEECFEEAHKKMAINGLCVHALEQVCVDHFKSLGNTQQIKEAEGMKGTWEAKASFRSSSSGQSWKIGKLKSSLDGQSSSSSGGQSLVTVTPILCQTIISIFLGLIVH